MARHPPHAKARHQDQQETQARLHATLSAFINALLRHRDLCSLELALDAVWFVDDQRTTFALTDLTPVIYSEDPVTIRWTAARLTLTPQKKMHGWVQALAINDRADCSVLDTMLEVLPLSKRELTKLRKSILLLGIESKPVIQWITTHLSVQSLPDDFLHALAMRGEIELVKYVGSIAPTLMLSHNTMEALYIRPSSREGKSEQLSVLRYILKNRNNPHPPSLENAVFARNDTKTLTLVEQTRGLNHLCGVHIDEAALTGHIDAIRFVNERFPVTMTAAAMDTAAANGHLKLLKYLHSFPSSQCSTTAMDQAAANGRLDMVEFLHTNRSKGCTARAINDAALNGHLKVVKFLHEHRGLACSKEAMDWAAGNGHLEVVKYIHSMATATCSTIAMDVAAFRGHLEVVQFLHFNRTEGCTEQAMNSAAKNGHLAVVEFLHTHRSEGYTKAAMDGAAATGHLDVVQFLHFNRSEGCTSRTIDQAVLDNRRELAKFLLMHRDEEYSSILLTAHFVRECDREMLQILHARGRVRCSAKAFAYVPPPGRQWPIPIGRPVKDPLQAREMRLFVLKELDDPHPTQTRPSTRTLSCCSGSRHIEAISDDRIGRFLEGIE